MGAFAGMMAGLSKAMADEHDKVLSEEKDRRSTALQFWTKLAFDPNVKPWARETAIQRVGTLVQTPILKKVPNEVYKFDDAFTRPQQQPQVSPQAQQPQNISLAGQAGATPGETQGQANQLPPPPPGVLAPQREAPPPEPMTMIPPRTVTVPPPPVPEYTGPAPTAANPVFGTQSGYFSPEEQAAMATARDIGHYEALYKARSDQERRDQQERKVLGVQLGLTGDDLGNFIINKTIRDRATGGALTLTKGVDASGKAAWAWRDPTGVLREYTTNGAGRPLGPADFMPADTGSDTFQDRVQTAMAKKAKGEPLTPEDNAALSMWGEMHREPRPPQPQILYIPGMGLVDKQTGEVKKQIDVPTTATRTMIEAAPKVLDFADRIEKQVKQQASTLGPAASRWNEFMSGKVGAPNAEFTRLRTNVSLLTTMLLRMHVGSRGGQQMLEHFKELMDVSKQSPENLLAALTEIRAYADSLMKHGEVGMEGAPPPPGGRAKPIIQQSPSTGAFRHSLDGGKTWISGKPK